MKRYPLPDLLKGFAVFLIVPVHILEIFIDYPGRESIFGKTLLFFGGPFGVPVFMIVMGYFIAKSANVISIRPVLNAVACWNFVLMMKFYR